jgi:hypothetical protein
MSHFGFQLGDLGLHHLSLQADILSRGPGEEGRSVEIDLGRAVPGPLEGNAGLLLLAEPHVLGRSQRQSGFILLAIFFVLLLVVRAVIVLIFVSAGFLFVLSIVAGLCVVAIFGRALLILVWRRSSREFLYKTELGAPMGRMKEGGQ